ncbi:MAG: PTS sugar transporter subunit IIA [Alphaproteobacteria bacterium]|jgi:PTS system nitrogen regulatory IIA component|nr:PTS sugar transporter subunit IIA [Alphaproteobacteria bacterium]
MNISDILSEDMILIDVDADNKRHLLEKVADFIATKKVLDKNAVFDALNERENLGSTGYGNGVAFPHARIAGIDELITVFVRLSKALDYEAFDGKNVDLLSFLISPEKSGEDHLQALAAFSRPLKNAAICQTLRQARNAHEIYVTLQK